MSNDDEYMKLGKLYREMALAKRLIYDRRETIGSRETVFSFFLGENGDLVTVSDPLLLAELVLLGEKFEDKRGHGDHKLMLNCYGYGPTVDGPMSIGPRLYKLVRWDTWHDTRSPKIMFEHWLVNKLNHLAITREQKLLRHRLMLFLAQKNKKSVSLMESCFWRF